MITIDKGLLTSEDIEVLGFEAVLDGDSRQDI